MPSLATKLAAAAALTTVNFLSIGPAVAQQVNPNIGAGISTSGLGNISPAVDNLGCRLNPRACRTGQAPQQREPGSNRRQQGNGPRPTRP